MDPQYLEFLCPLSNTLVSLGCHSPGDTRILNTVDPLALVSNYYLKCAVLWQARSFFRGHRDNSAASDSDNMRNFVQLIQCRPENDNVLCTDLETAPKNALCMSKTIQNEMISVIGNSIQDNIIEVKPQSFLPS